MNYKLLVALAAAAAALSACDKGQQAANDTGKATQPVAGAQDQLYSGSGTITAVAGDQVTIAHGPIPAIGWPSMTMAYTAPADLASEAKVGSHVDFSLRKNGSAYQLTSLRKK